MGKNRILYGSVNIGINHRTTKRRFLASWFSRRNGHPATNGLAERNIQTLNHRLAAIVNEPLSMRQKVREILFRYRATPQTTTKRLQNNICRDKFVFDALKPN
ncbi:PREDICTED: uncharacterized protein LOC105460477 [Wasmannia auropunctata]|uniref:uncharacterized protein LOC105460477 n=1 Tax=Wasmannia auropunctata TaxID=64793 RepID=UPI0005ED74D1|nr:PREDICTED: uncharacterized protein LOC105460477 [Wasmannia auropunctata]